MQSVHHRVIFVCHHGEASESRAAEFKAFLTQHGIRGLFEVGCASSEQDPLADLFAEACHIVPCYNTMDLLRGVHTALSEAGKGRELVHDLITPTKYTSDPCGTLSGVKGWQKKLVDNILGPGWDGAGKRMTRPAERLEKQTVLFVCHAGLQSRIAATAFGKFIEDQRVDRLFLLEHVAANSDYFTEKVANADHVVPCYRDSDLFRDLESARAETGNNALVHNFMVSRKHGALVHVTDWKEKLVRAILGRRWQELASRE